jgi:hypothetical protein
MLTPNDMIFPDAISEDEKNSQHWREHNAQLAAFERWQDTPDPDYTFPAIHVAVILNRAHYSADAPEGHHEESK